MAPKSDPKSKPSGSAAPAAAASSSSSAAPTASAAASSSALRGASATPAPGARPAQSMVPSRGRGTGQKLLFRPVMPVRRKPAEPSVKPEASAAASSSSPASSSTPRGRGAGRGGARGRGEGRGFPRGRGGPPGGAGRGASFAPVEMIATGPFAQGSGALSRSGGSGSRGGASLSAAAPSWAAGSAVKTDAAARSAYRDPDKLKEREEYSDDENDVEIIDMDEVHTLDEMAPRAPPRMREKEEKRKAKERTKKAQKEKSAGDKRKAKAVKDDPEPARHMDLDDSDDEKFDDDDKDEARGADALDLSASEDEEIMDDLLDDFMPVGEDDVGQSPENRLYLFQFPTLFPNFKASPSGAGEPSSEASDTTAGKARRSVAFAEEAIAAKSSKGVKKEAGEGADEGRQRPEGQAGRLELYKDGRVAMRFGDVVMEVTGATQANFLQQVMVLDAGAGGSGKKRAVVLGELVRKFVVSPEVESMLNDASMGDKDARPPAEVEDASMLE